MTRHLLAAFLVLAGACEGDGIEPADEVASDAVAIQGLRWRGGVEPTGLVQIQRLDAGQRYPSYHTGMVVAKDSSAGYLLVLTSEQVVNDGTTPSTVTVVDDPTVYGPSQTGRYVNSSAFFPGAVIQTSDFSPSLAPLDGRASSALVGRALRCFQYSNPTTLQYVDIRVTGYAGDTLTAGYAPDQSYNVPQLLNAWDQGAMCSDWGTGGFVGFVTSANTINVTLQRIGGLSGWIGQMQSLARVRTHYGNARVALYNNLSSPMCTDIPWGSPYANEPVNQYPCHYGSSQRFWLDYSIDPNYPRLVSDASGLCIDVANATGASGQNLQQYPCHTGSNQRFEFSLWGDSAGGWRIRPLSGLATNVCDSVEGGSSPNPAPLEQRSCGGAWDQRWFLSWR